MKKVSDVLIIGSGIAGLSFAIKIAESRPDLSVLILTKSAGEESNTARAQGGIAVVLNKLKDSFDQHIEDTMKAGKGLSNRKVVEMVVSQAPARLEELMAWGASFDKNNNGELELGLEGGHSQARIVHHRDLTGLEMETTLLKKVAALPNISIQDHYFVTDLLTIGEKEQTKCIGVKAIDKNRNKFIPIQTRITFLATGGSGMIFGNTTNPSVATADGVAIANRAGARIKDMDFIQFHPTALYEPDKHPLFLISEAVRGFGAYVVNKAGKRFLFKYDSRGELATRDIVSSAIVKELEESREESVFLDCRHLYSKDFERHFPTIVSYCNSVGINPENDLIPIVPAAHYQCGGIEVDSNARTSIKNLHASGECAYTGLHGANRLASNSLLEALVYSHQAFENLINEIDKIEMFGLQTFESELDEIEEITVSIERKLYRLNELMGYEAVQGTDLALKEGVLEELLQLKTEINTEGKFFVAFYELKNMTEVAILILEESISRLQSLLKNAKKLIGN
ncbi:MAG: L-aspartate oxidase [Salegentibacter sp.]|uniref:L-aspartate oxidase n=1 Tax=Salegentibacter sp. TaxID=1903072 RepID=UPI0028700465|nr:L-aspartate oxidase [Salegentibacter sp.]MDR9457988.1 L-aspartate oxidase [Salegentibacter sp.]